MNAAQLINIDTVRPEPPLKTTVSHQRSVGLGRLEVCASSGKSRTARLYQQGCAKIRMPRNQGAGLEAIMINSSGGMTGGDRLDWQFMVTKDAQLTATTQACERIYKSSGGTARTVVKLHVEDGGKLNWLPQETILFDNGRFTRSIEIDLEGSAELLMVESTVFGRLSMGETIKSGSFHDRWRVRRGGQMFHAEDFRLEGEIALTLEERGIAKGHGTLATILLIAPHAETLLEPCRKMFGDSGGASFWNGKLLVRLLARNGYDLREKLIPLIQIMAVGNTLPKIWTN